MEGDTKGHNLTFGAPCCYRLRRYLTKQNIYSVICCSISFLLGWLFETNGPTLLELQLNTGVTFTMASTYITCLNLTEIIGSLMIGFVAYKKVNPFLLMVIGLTIAALSIEVIPFCYNYIQMLIAHGGLGISTGGLDILVIAEMSAMWGSTTDTPMHALYFSSSLGSVLSPICMTPFLKKMENTDALSRTESLASPTEFSKLADVNSSFEQFENITTGRSDKYQSLEAPSKLYIPYSISVGLVGIILLPTCVMFMRYITGKFKIAYNHDNTDANKTQISGKFLYVVLLITGLMSALDTSMEESFGDFVPSFCVTQMGWSSQQSAYVVLLAASSIVVGRLVGLILKASSLTSIKLMLCYGLLLIAAHIGLVISGIYSFDYGIWISSFLSGFGVSILSPCIFTVTEDNFFPVSVKLAAYFTIAASLGFGLNSLLIGYLMENVNYMQFAYVLLMESVIYVVLIIICVKLIRLKYASDKDVPWNTTIITHI